MAIATSSPGDEVAQLLAKIDLGLTVDVVTTADDADHTKPDPDILTATMQRARIDPSACLLVGDSRWDVLAANRAGIATIGVETGGTSRDELLQAGASAIYADARSLAERFTTSPLSSLTVVS